MEKVFVAKKVATKLFATEAAVDGALAEAAELMSVMLAARKDVNASAVFADDCQVKLIEAMKALSEARTAMVGLHGQLDEAKLRLGIRTKMDGSGIGKTLPGGGGFAFAEVEEITAKAV